MEKSFIQVRAAKSVAINKLKAHYERVNRRPIKDEDIDRLINENRISKEVYEDTIVELMKEGYLLPEDTTVEDTIILKVPSYMASSVFKTNEDTELSAINKGLQSVVIDETSASTPIPTNEKIIRIDKKLTDPQYRNRIENIFKDKPQNFAQNAQIPQASQQRARPRATIEARHAVMMVPEFNGLVSKKVFEFVEKVDNVYKIVDPNQIDLLDILIRNKISDSAEQLIRNQQPNNWLQLRKILLDHYATRKGVNRRMGDLIDCKQGSGTVTEFASSLQHICSGIRYAARDENMDIGWVPTLLLKTFLDGLNKDISIIVRAQRPVTYQEALHIAIETESELAPRSKSFKLFCSNCNRNNHDTKDCRSTNKQNRNFIIRQPNDGLGFHRVKFNNRNDSRYNPYPQDYKKNFQSNYGNKYQNNYGTFKNSSNWNPGRNFYKNNPREQNFNNNWRQRYTYNPNYWHLESGPKTNSNDSDRKGNWVSKNGNKNSYGNKNFNNNGNNGKILTRGVSPKRDTNNNDCSSNSQTDRINLNRTRILTPAVVMDHTL